MDPSTSTSGVGSIEFPDLDLDRPAADQIFHALRHAILAMDSITVEAMMRAHARCMRGKLSGLMSANREFIA